MASDEFIALDAWFARADAGARLAEAPSQIEGIASTESQREARGATGDISEDATCDDARERAIAESRRWYARLRDALDAACERLLCELAAGVLARELQLAPCDLGALLAGIRNEMLGEPLRVRLHPEDCARWKDASLPCCADATLSPGDALLELREGSIDARFGVRLQAVLDACAP